MSFPTNPNDGDKYVRLGRTYQYDATSNTWEIYESTAGGNGEVPMDVSANWRFMETENGLNIECYINDAWVVKGSFGNVEAETQPPEADNAPSIFAPEAIVLEFTDPTTEQSVDGCSIADADSMTLIMDVTGTNGSLDLPLTSATYEEISGGLRITGSVIQINTELAGLTFTPTNLVGPPVAPQNGEINFILNDQDGGTANATHTITVEVIDYGR